MTTLTLTVPQRIEIARRLGVDPYDLTAERLLQEATEQSIRVAERTYDEAVEATLDAAIGRGAIGMDERPAWRGRLAQAPELVREVLDALPGDPTKADRALEADERIRSLADALDDYMGIPEDQRGREFVEQDDDACDPTGILKFRR